MHDTLFFGPIEIIQKPKTNNRSFPMRHHYDEDDHSAIDEARTFGCLAKVSIRILTRIQTTHQPKGGITVISGPMSTGGLGNFEDNMLMFHAAIAAAHENATHPRNNSGVIVFDQTPLQSGVAKLMHHNPETPGGYDMRILTDMYQPMFESNHVSTLLFLRGWESSVGARWEREQAERLGIEQVDIAPFLHFRALEIMRQHKATDPSTCHCPICKQSVTGKRLRTLVPST